MQWLLSIVLRYRSFVSFLAIAAFSLWLHSLPISRKIAISHIMTASIFFPMQYTVTQITKVRNIWRENKDLRSEVARLGMDNAELREKSLENQRLRELLQFKERVAFDLVPSEVVAQSPGRVSTSFILQVGGADGIERNMPVVSIHGAVGKVISIARHSCQVQLLSDPNCRIGVMLQRSRIAGILESEDGRKYKMRVQEHADVAIGDKIITSGYGGIFPKGLRVGTVKGIQMDDLKIYKELRIGLFVDFDYVEEVFVLRRKPRMQADTTGAGDPYGTELVEPIDEGNSRE